MNLLKVISQAAGEISDSIPVSPDAALRAVLLAVRGAQLLAAQCRADISEEWDFRALVLDQTADALRPIAAADYLVTSAVHEARQHNLTALADAVYQLIDHLHDAADTTAQKSPPSTQRAWRDVVASLRQVQARP